jgi:non-specific serine/threonine protein kinase
MRRGDLDNAGRYLGEALTIVEQLLDRRGVAECLAAIGGLAAAQGRFEQAAQLFGASDAAFAAARATPWPTNRADNEHHRGVARACLGEDRFAISYAEGQALPTERAVAMGLVETS